MVCGDIDPFGFLCRRGVLLLKYLECQRVEVLICVDRHL